MDIEYNLNIKENKNVTVNENKAPTDDSVRLLMEMQEKALKSIIATWFVEDNVFNAKASMQFSCISMMYEIYIKYSLNHHERIVKISVPRDSITENFAKKIKDALAEDVAEFISKSALMDIGSVFLKEKYGK